MEIRKKAEDVLTQIILENYDEQGYVGTLVFDAGHATKDFGTAIHRRDAFFVHLETKYPSIQMILAMGRGQVTDRIHFHIIAKDITREQIEKAWLWGRVTEWHPIKRSRETMSEEPYRALASYFCAHWTEEQGGLPFFATRNNTYFGKDYAEAF